MTLEEFVIGEAFWFEELRSRCTDVGTRTVAAIRLNHDDDPSWCNRPPYAVAESILDEYDLEGCTVEPEHLGRRRADPWLSRWHRAPFGCLLSCGRAIVAGRGEQAAWRYLDFFAANIRNANTRAAFARATSSFFASCEAPGLVLPGIQPVHVAAWIQLAGMARRVRVRPPGHRRPGY